MQSVSASRNHQMAVQQPQPKRDRIALAVGGAVATLALGGMMVLLGLNGIPVDQLAILGSSAEGSVILSVVMPILASVKKERQSVPLEEERKPYADFLANLLEGDPARFPMDYERNGANAYIVRDSKTGKWVLSSSTLALREVMRLAGLADGEIEQVKLLASQVNMTQVTSELYGETGCIGVPHAIHSDFLEDGDTSPMVYLISKGENGPIVESLYRFKLAEPGKQEPQEKYVIGRILIEPQTGRVEVTIGEIADHPEPFEIG